MQSELLGAPTALQKAQQSTAASRRAPRSVLAGLLSAPVCSTEYSAHHFLQILASLFQVQQPSGAGASRTDSLCAASVLTYKSHCKAQALSFAGSTNNCEKAATGRLQASAYLRALCKRLPG